MALDEPPISRWGEKPVTNEVVIFTSRVYNPSYPSIRPFIGFISRFISGRGSSCLDRDVHFAIPGRPMQQMQVLAIAPGQEKMTTFY